MYTIAHVRLPLDRGILIVGVRTFINPGWTEEGVPEIRDAFLRFPVIRIMVFGLYNGVPLFRETTTFPLIPYYNPNRYPIVI